MTELLLPRLKQEIEARLAELRPLIAEIEQLEAAKAALLTRSDLPAALAPARRRPSRASVDAGPRRLRRAPEPEAAPVLGGERAPRGANRDAILKLVEERPGVSVAEIASVTKIAKPTVATTVSKLKRDGVLADEAGGVKLASRQPVTLGGPPVTTAEPAVSAKAAEAAKSAGGERDEGVSDAEWESAAPEAGGSARSDTAA